MPFAMLAATLVMAGCTSSEQVTTNAVQLGVIEGVVTDPSQKPLVGATVVLDGANLTTKTDATGAFRFTVAPKEYLVLATLEGHRGEALRARPEAAGLVKLAFVLAPLPTEAPAVDVSEAHGLISCSGALVQGETTTTVTCGGQDPNERKELKFPVTTLAGLEGIVIELAWSPTTPGSTTLSLTVLGGAGDEPQTLGHTEGAEHVTLLLPARVLAEAVPAGSDLVVRIEPAGSFTDEEAALDAALDVQQPFTVYVSSFYHAAPPAGYSVVRS